MRDGIAIAIPSKNERFLNETIRDVLTNTHGPFTVYPVLDGYEPDELIEDDRVQYVRLPPTDYSKKRHAINKVAEITPHKYIMSLDAHCLLSPGYDLELKKVHQPNWVQTLRRHRLDPIAWDLQPQGDDRPPIDYEYLQWAPLIGEPRAMHGFKWDSRTLERMDIMVDDIFQMQASMWFQEVEWFHKCGFMQVEGFQGWGQESEEIMFSTLWYGGECKVNKNAYFAHLHKGPTYGRMYRLSKRENLRSYAYSADLWLNKRLNFFISVMERFYPLPKWPKDWKDQLWQKKNGHA